MTRPETKEHVLKDSLSIREQLSKLVVEYKQLEARLTSHVEHVDRLVNEESIELGPTPERIVAILDSITVGLFSLDKEWKFTYLNKEAENMFGLKRDEVIAKNLWELCKGNPPTFTEQYYKAMFTQKPVSFEGFSTRLGKWLQVHIYPSQEGLTVLLRDMTESKKTQDKLKMYEERFFKAFHHSSSIMVIMEQNDCRFVDVNKSFENITGYSREKVIGRTPLELDIWEEEEQSALINMFILHGSVNNSEVQIRTKNGEIRTCLVSFDLIESDGRQLIIVVAHDITEQRLLEQQVTRLDRFSSIAQIAASISHEVRNPMTTVRGFLQLLKDKPKYITDKETFELMIEEIDRANTILTEFLSLSGDQVVRPEPKNLNKILNDIFPLLLGDAIKADKNILLNQQPVPDLYLNKKELHQLILNLVRNGLESMSTGGKLIISTFQAGEEVVLSVKDEGSGIPEEIVAKLGTPFVTTKDNGTGLGLAVCYKIASRNNARIEVDTCPGGTNFFVRFRPQCEMPDSESLPQTENVTVSNES